MPLAALLGLSLLAFDGGGYARALNAGKLDQATLDVEGYGDKAAFKREDAGLRITLNPGAQETGWKTPQTLRIGGDFAIVGQVEVRKLPKPAQDDGVAVGLAIATGNLDQPNAVLVRIIERDGADVYRSIDQPHGVARVQTVVMGGVVMMGGAMPGVNAVKPSRKTFPARGSIVRFELRREGPILRYQVRDALSDEPRYLGQLTLGTSDLVGVKLFAVNRNGAEVLEVVLREVTIHADRLTGLGTAIRTVFGTVIHGEPIAIENGKLLVGAGVAAAPGSQLTVMMSGTVPAAILTRTPARAVEMAMPLVPLMPAAVARERVVVAAPAVTVAAKSATVKPVAPVAPDQAKAAMPASAKVATPPRPKPKSILPLDEVESIAFERALVMTARFLGQSNLDVTGPGGDAALGDSGAKAADDALAPPPGTIITKVPKVEPKPNGIRDLHLTLANLREAAIKQVTIQCPMDGTPVAWRLDTSDSKDWPLVLRRAGSEVAADLFLEPPPGDVHQKSFTIMVQYADGQSANATVRAEAHTDPKFAFDSQAPMMTLDARIYLIDDEQLFGTLEAIGEDSLTLATPWRDRLEIPLSRVIGLYMGLSEHKESPEAFARRLKARGTEDLLLATTKAAEIVAITGVVEGTDGDRLRFRFQEQSRTLPLSQVEGLILAARPETPPPDILRQTFTLAGGIVISGRLTSLDAGTWKLETPWGQTLNLPAAEIGSVRFRGGRVVSLSDMVPSRVEETPYFGRRNPWRKDVSLTGEPLKVQGRTYARGLAVHSRTVLTYELEGRFDRFRTLLGFDDAAKRKGRVDCQVLADGKVLLANPDLRADAPPTELDLKVSGAMRLTLSVDFGPDEDTGDRVIWADARLYREVPADVDDPSATKPKAGSGQ